MTPIGDIGTAREAYFERFQLGELLQVHRKLGVVLLDADVELGDAAAPILVAAELVDAVLEGGVHGLPTGKCGNIFQVGAFP